MTKWPLLAAAAMLASCAPEPSVPAEPTGVGAPNEAAARISSNAASLGSTDIQHEAPPPASAAIDAAPKPTPAAGACDMQDGAGIAPVRLRAIGTEPFWGARIQGRCVTYSHPDDQSGTRVWTKFSGSASAGTWTGALDGSPFSLRTRPEAGCSDGMSDRRYPIAVSLTVMGEERQGCAEPL